jgi:hypothetical protein
MNRHAGKELNADNIANAVQIADQIRKTNDRGSYGKKLAPRRPD